MAQNSLTSLANGVFDGLTGAAYVDLVYGPFAAHFALQRLRLEQHCVFGPHVVVNAVHELYWVCGTFENNGAYGIRTKAKRWLG